MFDISGGYKWSPEYNRNNYYGSISPRWRVNDRLTFRLSFDYDLDKNNIGYVDHIISDGVEEIVFGRRDLKNIENVFKTSYIFTNKLAMDFRLRHYWLNARYKSFYYLTEDGYLEPADYSENNDFEFNAFNIDMVIRWEFAPGSELALAWKNAILTFSDSEIADRYLKNLEQLFESPADNSLSLKVLYYLDYVYFKRKK